MHDVRAALAATFAWLRSVANNCRGGDLADRFVDPEQARTFVRLLVTKPEMRPSGRAPGAWTAAAPAAARSPDPFPPPTSPSLHAERSN